METLRRVANLVYKEFVQFFRDRALAALILMLPVLQLVLLGRTSGERISDLGVALVDLDRSPLSRRLAMMVDSRRELAVTHYPSTLAEAERLLDRGDVVLVVGIPVDFAADLRAPTATPFVQLIAGATNTVPASTALNAARETLADLAADVTQRAPRVPGPPIDLRFTVRFNPTSNHQFFTVPAQVGFIVYQVTLSITSIAFARERELGTLEQLLVMPVRRVELAIGKAIPALVIGAVNFLLMLGVAVFYFQVPMRGSLFLLVGLTLLFILAEIAYGTLISAVAHTQQQAILLVFVLAMVDMTFSGYLVRVKHLPPVLRSIAQVVPFSHYLTIIRRIMLKGAGLGALWPHAAAIAGMGGLVLLVAVRSLSRRLD